MLFVTVSHAYSDLDIYQFSCSTVAEVNELALEYLTDEGLEDQAESSDYSFGYLAFAVNTEEHASVLPDAEAKSTTTFAEWLAARGAAVRVENVFHITEDD